MPAADGAIVVTLDPALIRFAFLSGGTIDGKNLSIVMLGASGALGADSQSHSFNLRTKRQLRDAMMSLNFEQLCLFLPSMILTPNNRYGVSHATLALVALSIATSRPV